MSNPVIKVEKLSKQYRLGQVGTGTIRDDLGRFWAKVRGKEDPTLKIGVTNTLTSDHNSNNSTSKLSNYVWALRDINFLVEQGEVLGIIGKNGAGKSTLLKILSKVTTPTTGNIKVKGRIASLLEVGTGFHPELSGKENIFLNGAILGMTKAEIRSKFDEIVDFAGVERYINTPVKRYSSGMYVRLAFAVAAHLEPEILIVDEVLAVGDAEFQKKALGKMKSVSKEQGRTVLFVSHNMAAIKSLCTRGIVLKNGIIQFEGSANDCIQTYISNDRKAKNHRIWNENETQHKDFILKEAFIKGKGKNIDDVVEITDPMVFEITFITKISSQRIDVTLHVKDGAGDKIFMISSAVIEEISYKDELTYSCEIPANFFNNGNFSMDLYIVKDRKEAIYIEPDFLEFTLINKPIELGQYMGEEPGALRPQFQWNLK